MGFERRNFHQRNGMGLNLGRKSVDRTQELWEGEAIM